MDVSAVTHGQVAAAIRRFGDAVPGNRPFDTLLRAPARGDRELAWGNFLMVMWPALTLIGFVLLTAFVVLMGMQSTARYEREQRGEIGAPDERRTAADAVVATAAAA